MLGDMLPWNHCVTWLQQWDKVTKTLIFYDANWTKIFDDHFTTASDISHCCCKPLSNFCTTRQVSISVSLFCFPESILAYFWLHKLNTHHDVSTVMKKKKNHTDAYSCYYSQFCSPLQEKEVERKHHQKPYNCTQKLQYQYYTMAGELILMYNHITRFTSCI